MKGTKWSQLKQNRISLVSFVHTLSLLISPIFKMSHFHLSGLLSFFKCSNDKEVRSLKCELLDHKCFFSVISGSLKGMVYSKSVYILPPLPALRDRTQKPL